MTSETRDRVVLITGGAKYLGREIPPHQGGGPIATAVCLQLAACVPNFLIQEHFDAFNTDWTRDLVTWHPSVDMKNGHLSLPTAPGLGIDFNIEAINSHPCDEHACLNIFKSGWEKRIGTGKSVTSYLATLELSAQLSYAPLNSWPNSSGLSNVSFRYRHEGYKAYD